MALTLTSFAGGAARPGGVPIEQLGELARRPDELVWVDAAAPTPGELDLLERQLGLPPLAVEDAREAHQRPKADLYADCALIVAYAVSTDASDAGRLSFHEIAMFVGRSYFVTVRQAPQADTARLTHWLTETQGRPLRSTTALAHAALDVIVDRYFKVVEEMQSSIEDLDDRVWDGLRQEDLTRAFALRRDLVRFRRMVSPLREMLNALVRREGGVLDDSVDENLRDLHDHVVTVHEEIEMARELLATALEAHLSMSSNRLNRVVLRVSAWAAIIAVPTVIASIYGMNFERMPELHWSFGYPFALTLMIAAALALYAIFKRQDWL
jgi:magnesium transporter